VEALVAAAGMLVKMGQVEAAVRAYDELLIANDAGGTPLLSPPARSLVMQQRQHAAATAPQAPAEAISDELAVTSMGLSLACCSSRWTKKRDAGGETDEEGGGAPASSGVLGTFARLARSLLGG